MRANFIHKRYKHAFVLITFTIYRYLTLNISEAETAGKNQLLFSIDQYLNTSENNSDQNIYYNIDESVRLSSAQRLEVEINLNWSQHENYLYFHVENFYYGINGIDKNINVGFKKLEWSENMDFFKSQEWQQQMQRNRLNPMTGGNLGVFYVIKTPGLNIDLMYSPFFLPSRGPDVGFENGRAVTQNPWFLAPPTEVPYEGDTFSTRYELKNPELTDFLKQQTIAIKALAFDSQHWSLNIGYANKPSPRFVTDLDFQANISDPSVPIDISIQPRALKHQLISSDLTYNFSQNSKMTLGYMNESFAQESASSDSQTYIQPIDQNVLSLIYSQETKSYAFSFGGIWREGGRSRAIGELSSALVNQNINYLYERALKIDFKYFKTWGWTVNTSASYDFRQNGILTTVSLQTTINDALLNIGFDALEPINATDESSFIYQFRNLDRVWAGVSYVF